MAQAMYPGDHARETPDKPAVIHASSGRVVTYRELDARSNQLARYLQAQGLRPGDHIAVLMDNNPRYFEAVWAALRSGLMVTPVNRYLTAGETAYILADSAARAVISSHAMRELATGWAALADAQTPGACPIRLMVDGVVPGWTSYEEAIAAYPTQRLDDETLGATMLYSSGTTGRPKGVVKAQPQGRPADGPARHEPMRTFGFSRDTVYLSPAPLYHAAPLGYSIYTQYLGGTVVVMDKFDALEALRMIEKYRITHSQWVPTMFVRMLKLPPEQRAAFDLSSHQAAVHAAAPCPVEVKQQMIDWWGPILVEYYGGSEGNGATALDTAQWLSHPGSVGRAIIGTLHICDDDGNELPVGETGVVYFERDELPFRYHNDPEKTRNAQHPRHPNWTTLGDIGRVDADGFLYLTDRKAFMIISGGVNIYPQQVEDALALHPQVLDVAVIGVPNEEMGEEVKAFVEPAPGVQPSEALAEELIEFLRSRVARYMVPRTIEFVDELPRTPTGKLQKHVLRARYVTPR